ncbi:hypothetical protein ACFX2I_047099 [Malus domestica]
MLPTMLPKILQRQKKAFLLQPLYLRSNERFLVSSMKCLTHCRPPGDGRNQTSSLVTDICSTEFSATARASAAVAGLGLGWSCSLPCTTPFPLL